MRGLKETFHINLQLRYCFVSISGIWVLEGYDVEACLL